MKHCNSSLSLNMLLFVRPCIMSAIISPSCMRQDSVCPGHGLCVCSFWSYFFCLLHCLSMRRVLYSDQDSYHVAFFSKVHCNQNVIIKSKLVCKIFATAEWLDFDICKDLKCFPLLLLFFFQILESRSNPDLFPSLSLAYKDLNLQSAALSVWNDKALSYCHQTLLHMDWIERLFAVQTTDKLEMLYKKRYIFLTSHYMRLCVMVHRLCL